MRPPMETAPNLSDAPHIAHGFFGRQSGGAHDFNMSPNFAPPTEVASNLKRATASIGADDMPIARLTQTHSNIVVTLDNDWNFDATPEADGIVTAQPRAVLSILTADCTPLIFADPKAGIIGACHAGWKGAVTGIISSTILHMVALGADPANIIAAIGPTISGPNYEVGPEFATNIKANHPEAAAFLFTPAGKTRAHFDLPGFAADQVRRSGVSNLAIVGGCTLGAPHTYFSHRAASANLAAPGRQISIIALV